MLLSNQIITPNEKENSSQIVITSMFFIQSDDNIHAVIQSDDNIDIIKPGALLLVESSAATYAGVVKLWILFLDSSLSSLPTGAQFIPSLWAVMCHLLVLPSRRLVLTIPSPIRSFMTFTGGSRMPCMPGRLGLIVFSPICCG